MNELKKFMLYKKATEVAFDWKFEDLMNLPIFMIHHIYEVLDEFIEEDKKRYQSISSRSNH
jgi:hypothetical protein